MYIWMWMCPLLFHVKYHWEFGTKSVQKLSIGPWRWYSYVWINFLQNNMPNNSKTTMKCCKMWSKNRLSNFSIWNYAHFFYEFDFKLSAVFKCPWMSASCIAAMCDLKLCTKDFWLKTQTFTKICEIYSVDMDLIIQEIPSFIFYLIQKVQSFWWKSFQINGCSMDKVSGF